MGGEGRGGKKGVSFPFLWYKHPDPPLTPLSQREGGGGRKGEYIKCERSFQYIIYILQTPFLLYTPPLYPSSLSLREREGRAGPESFYSCTPPNPPPTSPIYLYTQIPLLPVINKWGEWEGGLGNGTEHLFKGGPDASLQ